MESSNYVGRNAAQKTNKSALCKAVRGTYPAVSQFLKTGLLLGLLLLVASLQSGCGSSGYPGGGISSLTASSITIDAGQSIAVGANGSGTLPLQWTLSGAACSGGACGTLSSSTGTTVTYMAPAPVAAPFQVTLRAMIAGTENARTVAIQVDPAPAISGNPPAATVGVPYSFTFSTSGGTAPLKLSLQSGTLPAGLAFDPATGKVTGTPTVVGTFPFVLQLVDNSDVPFTVTAGKQITVGATAGAGLSVVSGNPPTGSVGVAYSTMLQAAGGTSPYTWSVTAGSLPAGLTLNATTGVIAGTPAVAGSFSFTAQATDATGATASGSFSITILAAAPSAPVITTGTLPSGTVNVAYSATIGASGGTAPYTCVLAGGSLPAGLVLNANCSVTGTPTTAATSTFSVKVTDAGNPPQSGTGMVSITINPGQTDTLTLTPPPPATAGTPYTGTIGVSGGTGPYRCVLVSGTLVSGLTLRGDCGITGTPITSGTDTITVQVTDSNNPPKTTTAPVTMTVNPATLSLTNGNLPNGTVQIAYSATIGVSGGTAPYSCALISGTLPAGLSLAANCAVTGTPTTAGTSTVNVRVTDSAKPAQSTTGNQTITINPAALSLTNGTLPNGTVNVAYMAAIGVSGGTAPYTCSVVSGTLPAGLTLAANCSVSGTPTVAGTATVNVRVTDSANPAQSTTGNETIVINPAALSLGNGNLPDGTVNVTYNAPIVVSGGTAPYTCALVSGTLPAGLTLNANCSVSGTPTVAGTSTVVVRVTDSANPAQSTTGNETIVINPATLSLGNGTLPDGTVNVTYNAPIVVSGGTAPYTCALGSGALPSGLTLNANCLVSGTPTVAGTATVNVRVTDSANPAQSTTGNEIITINPAALTLTNGLLPDGTVNVTYSASVAVSGGTAPYTCALVSGTLPAGLTLNANCSVSGTPTAAGTSTINVRVTDATNPAQSTTGNQTITINPAALSLGNGTLPGGTVGITYSGSVGITGGTAPYTCVLAGGTLPAGLTLNANCSVTGTPTVAGTSSVSVRATDASNPAQSTTGPQTITIQAGASLTISSPPAATVNTPYTGTVPVTGGTAPYTCTLAGGTLPAGLTLNANCTITGTPTTPGAVSITVQATDSSSPARTTSGTVTVTVNPNTGTLTLGNPPVATVSTPYTGTVPVTGGTAPFTCVLASGTLPAGLTLNGNCTITGTPTTDGSVTVQVTATDSSSPTQVTGTGAVTITVQPVPAVTLTGSLPNAVVNQLYTQTLQAAGGVGPYTYTLTAGTLPNGITLSSTGVISGTPTTVGASTFTVTATDSEGTPKSASLPLVLLVTYAPTPNDALLQGPYAFLFQGYDDVAAGVLAYQTATAGSISADGNGAITAGEQDSNHQGSNPAGNTVATRNVLGTYTIGTDRRGTLALTTLNADSTVATTTIYAIALRAPVALATNAAAGSLIEFDGDQLAGTKGSGMLLAQTATAFTTGLSGSYAFGITGDTPCLPSCTIGIAAGPVATVGQFTAAANTISGGTADTNIGSINTASSALSGTYTTADTNGRVQLNLSNAKLAGVPYPTDFAAYVVDANRVLLLSTDKHSAYILQAGTATVQTVTAFSNASLGGAFVGYENSPVSPGLLNTTLQNVLNLSTATVFRGTANGSGTCTTTNVDSSGTTGVVNSLGGIVSAPVVNALLGSYQARGNSSCTVAANGRAVLHYPPSDALLTITLSGLGLPTVPAPRVAYLTGTNQGYFLETGYAGLGTLEAQTGAPYSNAGLNGTYVYASVPASTLATVNSSGIFTADGAGNATSTVDRNVGVGTINVLQLGVTATANYNVTDTAAGRFFLNTGEVIYEIAPGRFVLLEPELVNTSAYVALLF